MIQVNLRCTSRVFRQCECACASPIRCEVWKSFHKKGTCEAFLQCEHSCAFEGRTCSWIPCCRSYMFPSGLTFLWGASGWCVSKYLIKTIRTLEREKGSFWLIYPEPVSQWKCSTTLLTKKRPLGAMNGNDVLVHVVAMDIFATHWAWNPEFWIK